MLKNVDVLFLCGLIEVDSITIEIAYEISTRILGFY